MQPLITDAFERAGLDLADEPARFQGWALHRGRVEVRNLRLGLIVNYLFGFHVTVLGFSALALVASVLAFPSSSCPPCSESGLARALHPRRREYIYRHGASRLDRVYISSKALGKP